MRKYEKIMMVILIVLSITTFNMNRKVTNFINNTQNNQYNFYNEINRLNSSIGEIQGNVARTMEEIKSESLWIPRKEYTILDLDGQYENVDVLLQWQLRELNKEAEVYLVFSESDGSTVDDIEWTKLQLVQGEGLNYQIELSLSYKKNYVFQLIEETSRELRSENLFELNFQENFQNRIGGYAEVLSFGRHDNKIEIHIGVFNSLYDSKLYPNIEKLKMKSAIANVYVQGQLNQTIDLMKQRDRWGSGQDESINHFASIQVDNVENLSNEDIEVEIFVEDHLGNTYKPNLKR